MPSLDAARALLERHPLIDGHNDLPITLREAVDYDLARFDLAERQTRTQTDLVRLAEGGVGAQFWSVYVPGRWAGERAVTATLEQIEFVRRMVATYPGRLAWAESADELERANRDGLVASLIGAEGGHSIDCSLGVLRTFYRLGVRYLTLTHNNNVPWADAATDVPRLGGLSGFGREVVSEMNALGMMVDLSHAALGTMHDALECTRAPVIFSHSSARALVDHVRNVPDEVLAALATNGGLCMVTFVPQFVSADCHAWEHEMLREMDAAGEDRRDLDRQELAARRRADRVPPPEATIAQVADHIEHVREVADIGCVGIGGDFDGSPVMPAGLSDVSMYPRLFVELLDRHWSERELAALARGNLLRVLRDVESVAKAAR
ncbi:MAG: dipeptidase [Actinobacteria bacterium]|nr:dipeptidase [Actinomycetota bacterium]